MEANPYAKFLGGQDARAVIASTPGLLSQAIAALTPERALAAVAPGKWSPRQIVAHLADCELAHGFRLRQTLAATGGEPALLQPFDQDAWARHDEGYDLASALETFRAVRGWNLKLIGTLTEADMARSAHHPERGDLTLRTLIETMAGHDLNHLLQLQRLSA